MSEGMARLYGGHGRRPALGSCVRQPGDTRSGAAVARPGLPAERRRDPVEERRVRLAREDADQRRRAQAQRRAPARPVERQRVERLGARQDRDVGAGREGPGLEVGQQARVLLGLLGDPQDRRLRDPDSRSRERDAGRAPLRRSRGRSGCRAGRSPGGRGARPASTPPAARARPGAGPPPRRSRPRSSPTTEVSSHSSRACRRKIASAAARPADVEDEAAARRRLQQPVRREAAAHLAGGLRGHARRGGRAARTSSTRPSEPITRRARRYSWAAAEMSAVSVRRMPPSLRRARPSRFGRPQQPDRGRAQRRCTHVAATMTPSTDGLDDRPRAARRPRGRHPPGQPRRGRRAMRTTRPPPRPATGTGPRSISGWSEEQQRRHGLRARRRVAARSRWPSTISAADRLADRRPADQRQDEPPAAVRAEREREQVLGEGAAGRSTRGPAGAAGAVRPRRAASWTRCRCRGSPPRASCAAGPALGSTRPGRTVHRAASNVQARVPHAASPPSVVVRPRAGPLPARGLGAAGRARAAAARGPRPPGRHRSPGRRRPPTPRSHGAREPGTPARACGGRRTRGG